MAKICEDCKNPAVVIGSFVEPELEEDLADVRLDGLGTQPGDLEIYCHDGEYGITERNEPAVVLTKDFRLVPATGPMLTPWIPNQDWVAPLVSLVPVNSWQSVCFRSLSGSGLRPLPAVKLIVPSKWPGLRPASHPKVEYSHPSRTGGGRSTTSEGHLFGCPEA
jgi:hypothetical protein